MGKIIELWREAIRKASLVMLPSFFFLMIFSFPILTLFYTTSYANSVPIFRTYLFLLPLRIATYSLILQAIGNTRDIMKGSVYYLIINIVLNYTFIRFIGLIGPAIATVLATFLLAVYYLMKVRKAANISLKQLFPWSIVMRIFMASAVAAGSSALLLLLEMYKLLQIALAGIIFIAVFVLVATLVGVLTKKDKMLVKDWLLLKPIRGSISQ